jgi:glucose-1-phosphate adenylyltransferase
MLDAQTRNETPHDTHPLTSTAPRPSARVESLSRVATFVLAGGRGERLGVLSEGRAKPALPFGTQGRLLDFTLDNCARAGVPYALVLGQYQWRSVQQAVVSSAAVRSSTLRAHLRVSRSARGTGGASFRGTADAVYQNLDVVGAQTEAALVLAGDHVYSMDYRALVATHQRTGADITIAVAPIARDDVHRFGVVQLDGDGHVSAFEEKPDDSTSRLASMGIYVFNPDFLRRTLASDAIEPRSRHDFGHDILPRALRDGAGIAAHRFDGYWRDVGTVDAYWEANIDLTATSPELNLYDRDWPIWTFQEQLPPAKFVHNTGDRRGLATESTVSGGCIISGALNRSLLFSSCRVHSYARVESSVLLPEVVVGRHARLTRTIVDHRCRIPDGLVAGEDPALDAARFHRSKHGVTLITRAMLERL